MVTVFQVLITRMHEVGSYLKCGSLLSILNFMDPYKNSIVHEYRVLYSTRIVQKDKKWCDGILRYYEVNNKVELSHPTQLLLVSDFLNGSVGFVMNEILASGHEFKLPNKLFLVMVDEKIGSSVRDVSQAIRARNDTVVVPQPFVKSEPSVKIEPLVERLVASSRLVTDNKPIRPLAGRKVGISRPSSKRTTVKQEPSQFKPPSKIRRRFVRIPPRSSTVFQYLNLGCYN